MLRALRKTFRSPTPNRQEMKQGIPLTVKWKVGFFSSWAYRILCQCAIAESQLLKTLCVQVTTLVIVSSRHHVKSISHNCSWLTWNSYNTFLGTLLDILHGLPHQLIRNEALFCCSVTQLCPTLSTPWDCSTPDFPVLHHLPEFAQTHVHWVIAAIQPPHSLLSPSPPDFSLSQH